MPSPMNTGETYIGDGLYFAIDSGMVRLRAPRFGGDHVIYMEPQVLVEFARALHVNDITLPTFSEANKDGPTSD